MILCAKLLGPSPCQRGSRFPLKLGLDSGFMAPYDWDVRKHKLYDDLAVYARGFPKDPVMVCIRILRLKGKDSLGVVLDLGLPERIQDDVRRRRPTVTGTQVQFDQPEDVHLVEGDYMLKGAVVQQVRGPLPSRLWWPAVTKHTGHVRLTTTCDAVGSVVELFSGGLNSWSQAAKLLPIHVSMRVDWKPQAVEMMQINQCQRNDEETDHSVILQGDVCDMHILSRFQDEEGLLASPPCQPFSGMGMGQGLSAQCATSWDALFRVLRTTQRRFLVLENVLGLLRHADLREIMRAMGYCGYALVAQRVCSAVSLGCAARPRVLMVFWNTADCQGIGASGLQVPSFFAMGPPVTAAYHRSAALPEAHIKSKGLHVPVLKTNHGMRRLSKWEILHSMGMSPNLTIPADEGDAVAILGESFPPAHAFEAILLALSLHPHRIMSQSHIDSLFQLGIEDLSPRIVDWAQMDQVACRGWARLVCKGMEPQEGRNLEMTVQSLWQAQSRGSLLFKDMGSHNVPNSPPAERTFFHCEEDEKAVLCKVCRPEWPAVHIMLPCLLDGDLPSFLRVLADIWSLDDKMTVLVQAKAAKGQTVLLIDEVSSVTVPQRLVYHDDLIGRAVWLRCEIDLQDVRSSLGCEACTAFTINGMKPVGGIARLEDGDVIRLSFEQGLVPAWDLLEETPGSCTSGQCDFVCLTADIACHASYSNSVTEDRAHLVDLGLGSELSFMPCIHVNVAHQQRVCQDDGQTDGQEDGIRMNLDHVSHPSGTTGDRAFSLNHDFGLEPLSPQCPKVSVFPPVRTHVAKNAHGATHACADHPSSVTEDGALPVDGLGSELSSLLPRQVHTPISAR